MSDVVVSVPAFRWAHWLHEGDLAGEPDIGTEYFFSVPNKPSIKPGERVYIVALGKLRGYAPLVRFERGASPSGFLVRRGGAVAVTLAQPITSFRAYRYRWWRVEDELPFHDWTTP